MSKITPEQEKIINSFTCERLSSNKLNKNLINSFYNEKGQPLVDYLKIKAWEEDVDCNISYFLIKDSDDDIALFFSLKCGTLFRPFDQEIYQSKVYTYQDIMRILAMVKKENTEENKKLARDILEKYRTSNDEDIRQTIKLLIENGINAEDALASFENDKIHEINTYIHRVSETYPAIEIFHFCANDKIRDKWKRYGLSRPMGEVLFWSFIAPKICEIKKIIGCQYVFLFAADESENENLINYYNVSLKFERPKDITTAKPYYDFLCSFMCQEIKDLITHQKEYFEHFNPDEDLA